MFSFHCLQMYEIYTKIQSINSNGKIFNDLCARYIQNDKGYYNSFLTIQPLDARNDE